MTSILFPILSFLSFLPIPMIFPGSHFYLSSPFSAGTQELARQNQITTRILEAYIQKKLGLARNVNPLVRPPSILDILPAKKQKEEKPIPRFSFYEETDENDEDKPEVEEEENSDLSPVEEEALQSVESEQIDSIYSEGMYKLNTLLMDQS